MESEYYVTLELSNRCRGLGHQHRGLNLATVTVEDIERWIWKEHGFFIETSIMPDCDEPFTVHIYSGVVYMMAILDSERMLQTFPDPFSARLAGVERVIEELEKRQSIAQMEKGTR